MTAMVKIDNRDVERIEYRGEPVVTLRMVDDLHKRPQGTARRNFNKNREFFVEGVDYFRVTHAEWSKITAVRNSSGGRDTGQRNSITFLTQTGYLMVVKSFTDALAWKIQRALVTAYFQNAKPEPTRITKITNTSKPKPIGGIKRTTLDGRPVLSLRDIATLHGKRTHTVQMAYYRNRNSLFLDSYNETNDTRFAGDSILLTESGYIDLVSHFMPRISHSTIDAVRREYFRSDAGPRLPAPTPTQAHNKLALVLAALDMPKITPDAIEGARCILREVTSEIA